MNRRQILSFAAAGALAAAAAGAKAALTIPDPHEAALRKALGDADYTWLRAMEREITGMLRDGTMIHTVCRLEYTGTAGARRRFEHRTALLQGSGVLRLTGGSRNAELSSWHLQLRA